MSKQPKTNKQKKSAALIWEMHIAHAAMIMIPIKVEDDFPSAQSNRHTYLGEKKGKKADTKQLK